MAYLVAAAEHRDLDLIRTATPEIWRRIRRYNLPVQLALAAAEEVMPYSRDPTSAAIISLAPCQPGSAELYRWGDVVTAGMAQGTLGDMRMNPTQTLHAVDNLAKSALAITYANRAECLGLGGAAGQAWCGLESVLEQIDRGVEEVLLMAGDQDNASEQARGLGVALLFARRARPFMKLNRHVRFVRIERSVLGRSSRVEPHAANGLVALLFAIARQKDGLLVYEVPFEHTDGQSAVKSIFEISS